MNRTPAADPESDFDPYVRSRYPPCEMDALREYLRTLRQSSESDWFFDLESDLVLQQQELGPTSRAWLEHLFENLNAFDLDALHEGLEGRIYPLPASEAAIVANDLRRVFARLSAGATDAGPRSLNDEEALDAWAKARGVLGRLEDPVAAVQLIAEGAEAMLVTDVKATIREAHLGKVDVSTAQRVLGWTFTSGYSGRNELFARILHERTSLYLESVARARPEWEARRAASRAFLARATEEDRGRAGLVAWLESMLGSCPEDQGPVRVVGIANSIRSPWRLSGRCREVQGMEIVTHEASLDLTDWELQRLNGYCSCFASPNAPSVCRHVRLLLDQFATRALDPSTPFVRELGTPSWQRFVAKIDQVVAEEQRAFAFSADHRLGWRVEVQRSATHEPHVQLTPILQKRRGTSEKFTTGRKVTLDQVPLDRLEQRDRQAMDLLLSASLADPIAPVLRVLKGHPRLYLGASQTPLDVREASVRLALTPAGPPVGGYMMRAYVGEHEKTPREIVEYTNGNAFVYLDEAESTCTIANVGAALGALLGVLAQSGRHLPEHALDELVRRIGALHEHVDIELPASLLGRRRPADGALHVRIEETAPQVLTLELRVRPIPGGPVLLPGSGSSRLIASASAGRTHVLRDLASERERADALFAKPAFAGTEVVARFQRRVAGIQAIVAVLALLRGESELVISWKGEPFHVMGAIKPGDLRVRVRGAASRLLLDGEVELGEERVSLALLLDAARRGQGFVELGPRRFALLTERLLDSLGPAADLLTAKKGGSLDVGTALAPALEQVLAELRTESDGTFERALERARAASDFRAELPQGLSPDIELRAYQVDGFRWLARLSAWGVGAILADDMGLGKTLQCLAMLATRANAGPQLVLAPTSVCQNWLDETRRFAPSLRPILYRGKDRSRMLESLAPGQLLIASYDVAMRDVELLEQRAFSTLVLDEAQAVKNASAARTRAARRLRAEWRVALTGTPLENHIGELFSIVDLVEPGLLGRWEDFAERFARPIEGEGSAVRIAALRRILSPFVLRRTKTEVLTDLPPRIEVVRTVSLSRPERELYDQARLAALARLAQGGNEARIELLAALTRLRRLVCHPRLYDEASSCESSKVTSLLEIVDELREEGRRALVFSQFTSFLDLVEPVLRAAGVSCLRLDGSTPAAERAHRVTAFQNGEADLFLISLKAGGTGLNLTAADTAILLDPWWNPAAEDQASSRAHRMGQTAERVLVIRLVAQGTIEERVLEMHATKRDLAAAVLSDGDAGARLTNDELRSLLESRFEDDADDVPVGIQPPVESTKRGRSKKRRSDSTQRD